MYAGALEKMRKSGPRRMLALDGGGIRGLITIEILSRIEKLLSRGRPDFCLADYFDYIAGTSTGAVIGTLLSRGKKVDEIRSIYLQFGDMMFDKTKILGRVQSVKSKIPFRLPFGEDALKAVDAGTYYAKRWLGEREAYSEYPDEPLINKLREPGIIGGDDVRLGTDELRTLLLVVLHNVTLDSPWPVCNNPNSMHASRDREIALWKLVRGSTAAPLYFPPQEIEVEGRKFVFVDGGVTSYNNPAFQLFLHATLKPYHLEWATGERNMLIVSVGTGLHPNLQPNLREEDLHLFRSAKTASKALFNAALYQQDLLCRAFGRCRCGEVLDEEVGDLIDSSELVGSERLFSYVRYNATLTDAGLRELGVDPQIKAEDVRATDSVEHKAELQAIGRRVAEVTVRPEHFDGFSA